MAPSTLCFAAGTPVVATRAIAPSNRCSVRMSAAEGEGDAKPKKQSIVDWAISKVMPYQDPDDKWCYEASFKDIMSERDEAKKALYKEMDKK